MTPACELPRVCHHPKYWSHLSFSRRMWVWDVWSRTTSRHASGDLPFGKEEYLAKSSLYCRSSLLWKRFQDYSTTMIESFLLSSCDFSLLCRYAVSISWSSGDFTAILWKCTAISRSFPLAVLSCEKNPNTFKAIVFPNGLFKLASEKTWKLLRLGPRSAEREPKPSKRQLASDNFMFTNGVIDLPTGPNTSLECALGVFSGAKPLLRRYHPGTLRVCKPARRETEDLPKMWGLQLPALEKKATPGKKPMKTRLRQFNCLLTFCCDMSLKKTVKLRQVLGEAHNLQLGSLQNYVPP